MTGDILGWEHRRRHQYGPTMTQTQMLGWADCQTVTGTTEIRSTQVRPTISAAINSNPVQQSPLASQRPVEHQMTKVLNLIRISVAAVGVLCMLQAEPGVSQEKRGVIPHAPLLKTVLPATANLEVAVYETEYAPGGINPLHAGDSLFVPAGTIHSHWNPSVTDHLRFLEFIVAEKDKGRSIPQPMKK
jgi:hypothetical protein